MRDKVAVDQGQDNLGEELDVLAGSFEALLARELDAFLQGLHVERGLLNVLEKLFEKVVRELDLDEFCFALLVALEDLAAVADADCGQT